MKKCIALLTALLLVITLMGCGNKEDTIPFHGVPVPRAALSRETLEWLEAYNQLPEEGQMAISFVPNELIPYLESAE